MLDDLVRVNLGNFVAIVVEVGQEQVLEFRLYIHVNFQWRGGVTSRST